MNMLIRVCIIFIALWSMAANAQKQDTITKRILVISGGGARGAWGAGLTSYFCSPAGGNRSYKFVIGTSTGSLMGPFVLLKKFDVLHAAYTSLNQRSIFNVNPFKKNGDIRAVNGIWRALFYRTLGETENLRKLIFQYFTEQDYNDLKKRNLEFFATVTNMTDYEAYYMSSRKYSYESTVNWIWASSNQPVFMSVYETDDNPEKENAVKTKYYWQDGGLREVVPLSKGINLAIDSGIYFIDVIVHGTKKPTDVSWQQKGVLTGLERTIDILSESVKKQNLDTGILMEKLENCEHANASNGSGQSFVITIYYMKDEDYNRLSNSLVFDPDIMEALWKSGASGKQSYRRSIYRLTGESLRKLITN